MLVRKSPPLSSSKPARTTTNCLPRDESSMEPLSSQRPILGFSPPAVRTDVFRFLTGQGEVPEAKGHATPNREPCRSTRKSKSCNCRAARASKKAAQNLGPAIAGRATAPALAANRGNHPRTQGGKNLTQRQSHLRRLAFTIGAGLNLPARSANQLRWPQR